MKDKEERNIMVEVTGKDAAGVSGTGPQNAAFTEGDHMVQLLQVKTVLMGDVGAGKTSLLNALR